MLSHRDYSPFVHIIVRVRYYFGTIKTLTLQGSLSATLVPVGTQRTECKISYMEQKFCQSCGMPLSEEVLGTNADGSKN